MNYLKAGIISISIFYNKGEWYRLINLWLKPFFNETEGTMGMTPGRTSLQPYRTGISRQEPIIQTVVMGLTADMVLVMAVMAIPGGPEVEEADMEIMGGMEGMEGLMKDIGVG